MSPAPSDIACLVDIGPAVHQSAGLSRYAAQLATHLVKDSHAGLQVAAFYNRHSGHQPPASLRDLPTFSIPADQYRWRLSVLASQAARTTYRPVDRTVNSMAASSGDERRVLFHATEHLLPRLTCPTVLTVHDLIFDRLPDYHTRLNRLFLRLGMPLFIRNASAIIAVSQRTRSDLISRYPLANDRIHVVYEGIGDQYRSVTEAVTNSARARFGNGAPYLLMVGAIEPRKNHIAAMRALVQLRDSGYPHRLLIAGGDGWMFEPIHEFAQSSPVADRIEFLGFVAEDDLPALYSGADCFLLPSYYEGFGFTALEAMACGTPVICSNVGSLPEIAGNAALQVDPNDISALVQSVRNVLDQPRLADAMVRLGMQRADQFRWDMCAQGTVEVYREAVARHRV